MNPPNSPAPQLLGEVPDREEFAASLAQSLDALHRFVHAAREWTLPPVVNGCERYPEGELPYSFQAAWQYQRPQEFQQSLLDFLRVCFEPEAPGSLLLNGNQGLLLEALPTQPFRLAYLSETGRPGETLAELKMRVLDRRCAELGLDRGLGPLFGAICWGQGSLLQRLAATQTLFAAGFSADQWLGTWAAQIQGEASVETTGGPICHLCHLGYAIDGALGDRVRVSLWRFGGRAEVH